jgi:coenzyme F420-dependent glucose-6-phosphate dehydrogenase
VRQEIGVAELKLGYKASAEQFAPRELVELAVAAKGHGINSATVSDHLPAVAP